MRGNSVFRSQTKRFVKDESLAIGKVDAKTQVKYVKEERTGSKVGFNSNSPRLEARSS